MANPPQSDRAISFAPMKEKNPEKRKGNNTRKSLGYRPLQPTKQTDEHRYPLGT